MTEKIKINTTIERLRQLFPIIKASEIVDFSEYSYKKDFKFAFDKAYADATNRVTKRKQNVDNVDKVDLKNDLCDKLLKLYEKYFSEKISFEDLFEEGCNEIGNTFKDLYTNGDKFGIEQKLINMLFKYLYCYGDTEKGKFSKCYVPIDRYILSWYKRHIGKHGVKDDTWSNMSKEQFNIIQNELAIYAKEHYKSSKGGEVTPLQMEFYIWQEEQLFQAEEIIKKLAKYGVIKYLPVYDENEKREVLEAIASKGTEA